MWFSLFGPKYSQGYSEKSQKYIRQDPQAANYKDALDLYEKLHAIEPNAVKMLRAKEPFFGKMTPDLIASIVPEAKGIAEFLCERRQMR